RAGYKHIIVPVSRFVFPPNLRNVPRALLSTFKGSPSLRKTLRRVSTSIPRLVSIKEEPSDRSFVELSENLHGIERLWKSFFEENDCITLERTPDYLSWRIVGNPIVPHNIFAVERGDQISAYLSLAVRDSSECLMVDMLTLKDSLEDLRILLHRALTLLKGKSSLVTTWLTKNKVSAGYARMLCHTGFVELPESRMDMLVKTFDLSEEYSANVENWLINPIFTEGIS
ncbi:MAG: hypothetical protein ACE5IO_03105, partial [Thermoplasmata archaeon]